MKKALLITILLMILSNLSFAREVSFTEEDRARLRNIELKIERLEEGQRAINQRIDDTRASLQKQIDDMNYLNLLKLCVTRLCLLRAKLPELNACISLIFKDFKTTKGGLGRLHTEEVKGSIPFAPTMISDP